MNLRYEDMEWSDWRGWDDRRIELPISADVAAMIVRPGDGYDCNVDGGRDSVRVIFATDGPGAVTICREHLEQIVAIMKQIEEEL